MTSNLRVVRWVRYVALGVLACAPAPRPAVERRLLLPPLAGDRTTTVEHRTLTLDDGTVLRYTLAMPPAVAHAEERLPLVLVLHYSASQDSTPPYFGEQLLEQVVRPALGELRAVFVAPDAPGRGWADRRSERAVLSLLGHLRATLPIDGRRTLVTGYSLGGMGTWYLVARHPELFRAALPMASFPMLGEGRTAADREAQLRAMASDTAATWTRPFRQVPMYIIHSRQDELLPLSAVVDAAAALRTHGARAELVELEGITHQQTRAYVEPLRAAIPWIERQWARTDASSDTFASTEAQGCRVRPGWPILPEGEILGQATGVGVDSRGAVLVFHRAGRVWAEPFPTEPIAAPTVWVFDGATGRLLRRWGAGLFIMPHGLTVDRGDNVWLTDVGRQQVFKFAPDGRLVLTLGERGVAGADSVHFDRPTDVAVRPDGGFYVSDGYRNTRVIQFDASGHFVRQWGTPGNGPGQFNLPHGIVLDQAGRIYVADRSNARVQVFDTTGRFVADWHGPRLGRPYGVSIAPDGSVFTVDGGDQPKEPPDRGGATHLRADGTVLERFGQFGNYDGQFRLAHDVAVAADGAVYVADAWGQRVQKFVCGR